MEIKLKQGKLRSWKAEDATALAHHANNKKIVQFMRDGFPFPYTLDDAKEWLDKTISDDVNTLLAIDMDGEAIGSIGVLPFTNVYRKGAEIGYWLGESYWNKGIVTEAIHALVNYIFETTSLIRITACVFEKNTASMHVLEKAGFQLESIHKKAVYKNEQVMDEYQYVIFRKAVNTFFENN
jgi:ribosomal-protein-alanine N-acetyltransferase